MRGMLLWLLVLCAVVARGAPMYPDHLDTLVVRDVLWQSLPDMVRSVAVGPDGRAWFTLRGDPMQLTPVERVRDVVSREFSMPAPQVLARPVLFEPDGRVWFLADNARMLLGYDGTTWLTHSVDTYDRFSAALVSGPRDGFEAWAWQVDRWRFFPDLRGVHVFDGTDWTYQLMMPGAKFTETPQLYRDPDGPGMIAVAKGACWRWRAGTWSRLPDRTPLVECLADPATPRALTVGDYRVAKARFLHQDPAGTLYLQAEGVTGPADAPAAGLLIIPRAGAARLLPGADVTVGWRPTNEVLGSTPQVTADGRRAWVAGRTPDVPTRLLDLETGAVLATVPIEGYRWLQALGPDGTLFLGLAEPKWPNGFTCVLRPGSPNNLAMLQVQKTRLAGTKCEGSDDLCAAGQVAVASDGRLWANVKDRGFMRFDGVTWEPLAIPDPKRAVRDYVPGLHGEMLISFTRCHAHEPLFYWLTPGGLDQGANLRALIERNRAAMVAAYRNTVPRVHASGFETYITADADSNLWVLNAGKLAVLSGGRWLDATDAVTAAGPPTGEVAYIVPVGNGEKVFVHGAGLDSANWPFLGQIKDDQIVLTRVPEPATALVYGSAQAARDADGALWVGGYDGYMRNGTGYGKDQHAWRITRDGVAAEVTNVGLPRICDRSGNVWLSAAQGERENRFRLWRAGTVSDPITVPGTGQTDYLFSDAANSVFIWTPNGLVHLTAPAGTNAYRVAKTHTITGFTGTMQIPHYSPRGFVAVTAWDDHDDQWVNIVPLPQ